MKLVTLASPVGGRTGVLLGDEVLDFAAAAPLLPIGGWIPASMKRLIAGGDTGLEIIHRLLGICQSAPDALRDDLRDIGALVPLTQARLDAPVPDPGILLSHARAYHGHSAEMGGRPAPRYPIGFMKTVHSIIGTGAPIRLPASAPDMVDFEGEISVVFGRACHGVSAAQALDCIMGVTIVNDVSARDWTQDAQDYPDRNRMGKQFATFSPMGPWIATLDEIHDINDLHMTTRLNGIVMQDARSSDLIWDLASIIEYYARWHPFAPGDVLTTGTPGGVGFARNPPVFLRDGDIVDITVDGVGTLSNTIVAAPTPAPFTT